MKAKKLIVIVVLAAFGISVQAQIVSSENGQRIVKEQGKAKSSRAIKWDIRVGYSFDNMSGGHDLSGTSGFDASCGLSKPFGNSNLFWGIEAGAMTYGLCLKDDERMSCIGFDLTPRVGINIPFTQGISLTVYGGPYIGYKLGWGEEGKTIYYEQERYTDVQGDTQYRGQQIYQRIEVANGIDVGLNLGIELFVCKNFFFDFHIKKGLTNCGESIYSDNYYDSGAPSRDYAIYDIDSFSALKVVLGIGFQF